MQMPPRYTEVRPRREVLPEDGERAGLICRDQNLRVMRIFITIPCLVYGKLIRQFVEPNECRDFVLGSLPKQIRGN